MINKIADSIAEALAGVQDGATVLIGGFGTSGNPIELIDGLIAQGARDLTVVNNNAGNADEGLAALLKTGQVRKIICSFPGGQLGVRRPLPRWPDRAGTRAPGQPG
jgi:3-oxoadipate CoA-transferase alpha subunit